MKNFEVDDYEKAKLIIHIITPIAFFALGIGISLFFRRK